MSAGEASASPAPTWRGCRSDCEFDLLSGRCRGGRCGNRRRSVARASAAARVRVLADPGSAVYARVVVVVAVANALGVATEAKGAATGKHAQEERSGKRAE